VFGGPVFGECCHGGRAGGQEALRALELGVELTQVRELQERLDAVDAEKRRPKVV